MNLSSLIIKETADYLVIDKPARLLSIPDREGKEISLKILLREKYGEIFTVHRLDRETSGLVACGLEVLRIGLVATPMANSTSDTTATNTCAGV